MLTRTELVKIIAKEQHLAIIDAKKILEDLIQDAVHIRTRTIGSNHFTEISHKDILFEIKEKYRKSISIYLKKLEEIKKEKTNLDKQERIIKKKLEEIELLFTLK